ncbi:hypothetical protein PMAYCL1PPCAC_18825, partial [Pristionchus mayeri]
RTGNRLSTRGKGMKMIDDWMKTPGIALRSIKEIEAGPMQNRWRRAVMLGFDSSERGQRMKENHERLMNNLCDRYRDMKDKERKEEEKGSENTKKETEASFGTLSCFCDKSGNRVQKETHPESQQKTQSENQSKTQPETQSTPILPMHERTPLRMQQQHGWGFGASVANTDSETKFEGFAKIQQQRVDCSVRVEGANTIYTPEFHGFSQIQSVGSPCTPPPAVTPSAMCTPIEMDVQTAVSEKHTGGDFFGFGVITSVTTEEDKARSTYSMSSPNCSTPNESQLMSGEESSPVRNQPENIPDNSKPSFEEISSPLQCANLRVKEKVRRYDKEPTAAGKRYLKPLDKVQNSDLHRLTQIKFDRNRVKKWVGRFSLIPPVNEEEMETRRPRRYSDPIADVAPDTENLLTIEEEPVVEKREEEKVFEKMIKWMQKRGVEWSLEDKERVDFPREGSIIRARVVGVRGREATIVPPREFEKLAEKLKTRILHRASRVSEWAEEEMAVVLEQESDTMGVNEYRRGWMHKGDSKEVSVLLIDERRIVWVPRSSLFQADDSFFTCSPPLCVDVHFQREVMEHELEILLLGCSAECRVMEKEEAERLELSLEKMDTSGVTLDLMFCSEECAGACAYHRDELGY